MSVESLRRIDSCEKLLGHAASSLSRWVCVLSSLLIAGLATHAWASPPTTIVPAVDVHVLKSSAKIPVGASPPGEVTSVVIAPGQNKKCPNGRLVVVNDSQRPDSGSGVVWGIDLTQATSGKPIVGRMDVAKFAAVPGASDYVFLSNDQDLVLLPNGDVLYLTGVASKAPLAAVPAWAAITFRNSIGPGARSALLTWRSSDCGKNFTFVSVLDSASMGSCGQPQASPFCPQESCGAGKTCNELSHVCEYPVQSSCDAPGSCPADAYCLTKVDPTTLKKTQRCVEKPDMGGTDGQYVKVDPHDGRLYLAHQCVGNRVNAFETPWGLGAPLNETYLMTSDDGAATWSKVGIVNQAIWRPAFSNMADGKMVVVLGSTVTTGTKQGKEFVFSAPVELSAKPGFGWDGKVYDDMIGLVSAGSSGKVRAITSNNMGFSVAARAPGGKSFIAAIPAMVDGKLGSRFGYRVFFYRPDTNQVLEAPPILPAVDNPQQFIFQPTVIEGDGSGPVLFYWQDIDVTTQRSTVRGRLYFDHISASSDFVVSTSAGKPRDFSLWAASKQSYWYGDYHTAGGYFVRTSVPANRNAGMLGKIIRFDYHYFPIWIEPTGDVTYTEVVAEIASGGKHIKTVWPEIWKPAQLVADPTKLIQIRQDEFEPQVERVPTRVRAKAPIVR